MTTGVVLMTYGAPQHVARPRPHDVPRREADRGIEVPLDRAIADSLPRLVER